MFSTTARRGSILFVCHPKEDVACSSKLRKSSSQAPYFGAKMLTNAAMWRVQISISFGHYIRLLLLTSVYSYIFLDFISPYINVY
jgi:hypothetical protein